MKLIMESWRQYLTEEQAEELVKREIVSYLEENSIIMTEEQINELVPKALKRLGGRAAMLAALGGVGGVGASAQAGVGPVKDKITMMKKGVKDKAGDVKQKMQDLGVKVADSGEEDAGQDLSSLVGQGVQDGGDGTFTSTVEVSFKGNLSMAQQIGTSKAQKEISNHIAQTSLGGGDVGGSYNFSVTGMQHTGKTLIVQVTASPAGS